MKKISLLVSAPVLAAALALGSTPAASAATVTPQQVAGQTPLASISPITTPVTDASPEWRQDSADDKRIQQLKAYSPSMKRDIELAVIKADKPNAPTLYLLNGAGGAEQDNDWITLAPEIVDFYHSKGINVVIPMDGAFTYYLDWAKPAPGKAGLVERGEQKWETFLTKELPGPIEKHLNANNNRAIVGFSMSALSATILAAHNPGFYDAVAGFSGVYTTSDALAQGVHNLTLNRGGATAEMMLGPVGGRHARHNDAVINAKGLRGSELYFSTGSGLAGRTDQASYLQGKGAHSVAAQLGSATLQVEGGAIEYATSASTHILNAKLDQLGIKATYNYRPTGTHSWPYWRDDIKKSWATLERGLFR